MNVGIDTDFLVRLAILEHPGRGLAVQTRDRHLNQNDRFAFAPQVVSEFAHVVTDPRRFEKPLSMPEALRWAQAWGSSAEVDAISPNTEALQRFFAWMSEHGLGRKRILDTMLAATYVTAGVHHLITANPSDYRVFSELQLFEI